ncbi:unnamed protein product, partial [Brassica oleracea]
VSLITQIKFAFANQTGLPRKDLFRAKQTIIAFHDSFEDHPPLLLTATVKVLLFFAVAFSDPNMYNRKPMVRKKQGMMEAVDDPDLSFSKIMKDVQLFASSHMTWKDKRIRKSLDLAGSLKRNRGYPSV